MEHKANKVFNTPSYTNSLSCIYRVSYFLPLIFKYMSYFKDLEKKREETIAEQRKASAPSYISDSALKMLAVFIFIMIGILTFFKAYFFITLLSVCILILLDFYALSWILILVAPMLVWLHNHWETSVATFKEMYPSLILVIVIILLLKLYSDTK